MLMFRDSGDRYTDRFDFVKGLPGVVLAFAAAIEPFECFAFNRPL